MVELAREVREGMERLNDEYVWSAIDRLEVNKEGGCHAGSIASRWWHGRSSGCTRSTNGGGQHASRWWW